VVWVLLLVLGAAAPGGLQSQTQQRRVWNVLLMVAGLVVGKGGLTGVPEMEEIGVQTHRHQNLHQEQQ
jgi:hypothetical protein